MCPIKTKSMHRMIGNSSLIKYEYQTPSNKISVPNIIISDFRRDVGEIPDIISFCKEFLGRTHLSDKQKEAYLAVWGEKGGEWSTKFHEIVLLVGMKGGKNFWAEGDFAYLCFFYASLKDPHAYFSKIARRGHIPYTIDKTFDVVNVSSVDESQARRAFFESGKRALQNTIDPKRGERWFEKFAGLKLSDQFGNFKKKEVYFPTTSGKGGLRLLSFNSKAKAPEGMHMLRFYADELSRADTKASYEEATKLYDLGLNNTRVSFPNNVGKVIGWSYPNQTDYDLTNERYEFSLTSDNTFGIKATTVEFNPAIDHSDIENARKDDPIGTACRFECIKPISQNSFFSPHADRLDAMIRPEIKNRIQYKIIRTKRNTQYEQQYDFTSLEILGIQGDYKQRCFTMDPSKNKDRFVILGGYCEIINPFKMNIFIEDREEIITTNVRTIVDIMIVIEPFPDSPIDYLAIGDLLNQLIKAFPRTYSFSSDHFQNEKLRQELISKGVKSETYFFSNPMQLKLYTMLRANVWNTNINVCKEDQSILVAKKPISLSDLLLREGRQLIKEGNKIDHPKNGSKDILDSLAILNYDLMNLEVFDLNTNIDELSDEKLGKLATAFLKARRDLVVEDSLLNRPENKRKLLELIANKIDLSINSVYKLEKYIKDRY